LFAAVVCVTTGLSIQIKPVTWGTLIGGLIFCIMQSLCFAYASISEDDVYLDISYRAWNYFTSCVGLGFGVLVGRMVLTLEELERLG